VGEERCNPSSWAIIWHHPPSAPAARPNRSLWLVPEYGTASRRCIAETSMCECQIRSIRPLAGTARLVALSLLLTGCAALETGVGPPSLKDAPAPSANALTARPAPLMKASNVHSGAPAAPVSRGGGAGCGDQGCLDRLKALLEDRERKWIGQPQSPKDHADGTRQFAYRALRGRLTCNELTLAMDEIAKAIRAFAAPVAGVASDQVARVWALDGQVQDELRAEHGSRCAA
jgi:hypothetical protein